MLGLMDKPDQLECSSRGSCYPKGLVIVLCTNSVFEIRSSLLIHLFSNARSLLSVSPSIEQVSHPFILVIIGSCYLCDDDDDHNNDDADADEYAFSRNDNIHRQYPTMPNSDKLH